jgi:hypothetical protein
LSSWTANAAEAGYYIFAYESVWLPAALRTADRQDALADALFATSRIRPMELHFQKALAGVPPERRSPQRAIRRSTPPCSMPLCS